MIRALAAAAFVLVAAVGCGQAAAVTPPTRPLVVGAVYPLTGPQAPGGREELAGVRAALSVAHAAVQLHVISATTPDQATAAVDTLVATYHVPVIVGTYGSTLSAAAAARAEELKTVYWETGAVADPITARHRYVFRTVATGSALGRMAVTFTHDVLMRTFQAVPPRAVIVRVDDVYGRSVGGGEQQLAGSLGINVVDVVGYSPTAYDAQVIAARVAQDHPDFLWDVSYLNDGVAIWRAILNTHVALKAAIGTSSAFCMPAFAQMLGPDAVGVFAADKPDSDIAPSALSASGRDLLARAEAAYGGRMEIPAVAGFVGGWALFHDVLPNVRGAVTPDSIRAAALAVDVPAGDSINGGGVRFAGAGALDEGQNTRAAAVVSQWQPDLTMKVLFPAAYAG